MVHGVLDHRILMLHALCTYAATETSACDLKDGRGMRMWFTVFFAATETAICDLKDGLGMLTRNADVVCGVL